MYVINPAQGPLVILDYELSQEYFGMEHEEVVFLLSCMYSPHEDWDAIVAQNFKRELQSNEDDTSNLLFF